MKWQEQLNLDVYETAVMKTDFSRVVSLKSCLIRVQSLLHRVNGDDVSRDVIGGGAC